MTLFFVLKLILLVVVSFFAGFGMHQMYHIYYADKKYTRINIIAATDTSTDTVDVQIVVMPSGDKRADKTAEVIRDVVVGALNRINENG